MSQDDVGDDVHIGHGVGGARILTASGNTSKPVPVGSPENLAEVLGCLVRARRRMAAALAVQDNLIAHYRAAVRT